MPTIQRTLSREAVDGTVISETELRIDYFYTAGENIVCCLCEEEWDSTGRAYWLPLDRLSNEWLWDYATATAQKELDNDL